VRLWSINWLSYQSIGHSIDQSTLFAVVNLTQAYLPHVPINGEVVRQVQDRDQLLEELVRGEAEEIIPPELVAVRASGSPGSASPSTVSPVCKFKCGRRQPPPNRSRASPTTGHIQSDRQHVTYFR
jgi:hypothetical protein